MINQSAITADDITEYKKEYQHSKEISLLETMLVWINESLLSEWKHWILI